MQIKTTKYEIEVFNEDTYDIGSADNARKYLKEYLFAEQYFYSPMCGILCDSYNGEHYSCLILAGGAYSTVDEESVIVFDDTLFVAIGNLVCRLSLPLLEIKWHREVDFATCFGIYYIAKENCIISHGECSIARLSLDGDIVWSMGGKDIFTEGFTLYENHIEAIDFNHEKYRIGLSNGKSSIIKT